MAGIVVQFYFGGGLWFPHDSVGQFSDCQRALDDVMSLVVIPQVVGNTGNI